MLYAPQEFCNILNKAQEKRGNTGVLLALKVMDILENMVKQGKVSTSRKGGKTLFSLNKK